MLTDSLPTNATSSFGMSPSPLPQAFVPVAPNPRAWTRRDARADRDQARQPYHRAAVDMVDPMVEISPSDIVQRRRAAWRGMAAEIVEATRCDRIESRFVRPSTCWPYSSAACVMMAPPSSKACPIDAAGFQAKDQLCAGRPRIPRLARTAHSTRVVYLYLDPAGLSRSSVLPACRLRLGCSSKTARYGARRSS